MGLRYCSMKLKDSFEIVDVADEFLAVPVGKEAELFQGVVVLSETTAFLLQHMRQHHTKEELIKLLCEEYDVAESVAKDDVEHLLISLVEIGVVEEQ